MAKLHNYIGIFWQDKNELTISVWFEANCYYEAMKYFKPYKNCMGNEWVSVGMDGVFYTDDTPESPPWLDKDEVFLTIEQLKQHKDYIGMTKVT